MRPTFGDLPAGGRLGEIHIGYEDADIDQEIETPGKPLDWRVEKMKCPKTRRILYNDFLTLDGIPEKVFDYKLGNRSALEWVIDQYRVKTTRSGISTTRTARRTRV